ncbi:MAG TPA: hypothetical protein VJ801_01165 [Polyangia bacterium]|jgi:hypothetical protein|nr:hypothetical protein [Polyangia bacterium]
MMRFVAQPVMRGQRDRPAFRVSAPCQAGRHVLLHGRRASAVTLDELRKRFWWLGPDPAGSYIVALEGDTVTIKVIQCSWNRRTQKYEEAVACDFHAIGFKVVWQPFLAEKLRTELEKARESAEKAGVLFDEGKFMEQQRAAEIRRETSGW